MERGVSLVCVFNYCTIRDNIADIELKRIAKVCCRSGKMLHIEFLQKSASVQLRKSLPKILRSEGFQAGVALVMLNLHSRFQKFLDRRGGGYP